MEENGRRRNPPRKASMVLRPLNTNSVNFKRRKSHNEAILADQKKNEAAITTTANDRNSNDASRKENISPNVNEEEVVIDSKYASKYSPINVKFPSLQDCMHKSKYLDRNALQEFIDLGRDVVGVMVKYGHAKSMEDFRKDNKISQAAQEAYSTGSTRIPIKTIPREDNKMPKNNASVAVYLLTEEDEKGNKFGFKSGVNGDGKREHDYVFKKSQRYLEIVSFHDASDEAEAEIAQLYLKFLQRNSKNPDFPSHLQVYAQVALDGGMICSLFRRPIMCAVESYISSEFGISNHLKNNPHEFIVGTDEFAIEHQKVHDDTSDAMIGDIKKITENHELSIVAVNTTWKPDEKCLSNNGENFRSAHVDMMNYTIDKTPFDKKNVKDALPDPPRTKLVEDEAYCTNYSPSETREGREVISQAQELVANTEGGIGITYFNSVVTQHSNYNNLVEFLIECHDWAVWRVYVSSNGAKVYILYKNGSVYLVLNSSCRALNPNFSDDMQEDILSIIEIVRNALGGLDWKDKDKVKVETNHGKGSLVVLLSQLFKMTSVGSFYRSKLLHYFFVPDKIRKIYLLEYNNLPKTERVTTNSDSCRMRFVYKDRKVLSISIPSKNLRKDVEDCLEERNLKQNLTDIARNEEEFKVIMTTLVQMRISIYVAKNNPAKRDILENMFKHLYTQFCDSKDGFKMEQRWESTEIELYIKGFDYCYGNVLHQCIPSGKNNPFDHIAIRAWIPTRGGDSCKTFKKNIMQNVTNKNGFTLEMYRNELQKRLRIVRKWEEYSGHYIRDDKARFAEFPTNKRVFQMFAKKVAIYNDKNKRKKFIKDFVSNLRRKNIDVYTYDESNVSFQLVADPTEFFTRRFKFWRNKV